MTTIDDVAVEAGAPAGEVLAACRSLGIVASSGASGLSADEHRRLREALGSSTELPPVVAGSTEARPGAPTPPDDRSLAARAEELTAARRPRISPRTATRIALGVFLVVAVAMSVVALRDRAATPSCVDLAGDGTGTPRTAPCDEPHDAEVLGVLEVEHTAFPGQGVLSAEAEGPCRQRLADRVGDRPDADTLQVVLLVPTEASWAAGDRTVTCLVEDLAGPLTGPVAGSEG